MKFTWHHCVVGTLLLTATNLSVADSEHYAIDPSHTYPSLEFNHMGISIWRGKFTKTKGAITLDRVQHKGTVSVTVETSGIDFGMAAMDARARTDDYFDVAKWPVATYVGDLQFSGDEPVTVDGQLTLRGVTRPLKLSLDLFKCIEHPMLKRQVCGADAKGTLHWSDYGMNIHTEGGPDADLVTLHIQVEAVKQD